MPEKIAFYFDPLCPWCYLTSKWVHRLVELSVVEVEWRVFSLEVNNTGKTSLEDAAEFRAATALRTAIALRDTVGPIRSVASTRRSTLARGTTRRTSATSR